MEKIVHTQLLPLPVYIFRERPAVEKRASQVESSLINAYEQTLFSVDLPSGRVVLTVGEHSIDPALIGRTPLTVITAYNPGTDRPSQSDNEAANSHLEQQIKALGHNYYRAIGEAPDRSHAEPSFAVEGLSRDEAQVLGQAFHQACVLYWENGIGSLLWCREG